MTQNIKLITDPSKNIAFHHDADAGNFAGSAPKKELPSEGIYFNMPETEYHALPYFSRSFAEEVNFDLEEAEFSKTNSKPRTRQMELGTAIHAAFLEPKKFLENYLEFPNPKNFAGKKILKTCDDIKELLKAFGEKQSGKKEEMADRLRPWLNPNEFVIWDDLENAVTQEAEKTGKEILRAEDIETIAGIKASFQKREHIQKIIQEGYSEVTIIWRDEETGIICKCRLDYLRPTVIGELKSFSIKSKKKSLFEYLFKETISNSYNLQFAVYEEAVETIIKRLRCNKAKVFGEVKPEFMTEFLTSTKKQFFILYVRTAAPYQMKAIELEKCVSGGTNHEYYNIPKKIWREALRKCANAEKTGIWKEKEVETLDDLHVPSVMYQAPIY